MQRHYYAVFHPVNIFNPEAINRATLYRYDSTKQRAEDIERVNAQTAEEGPLYGNKNVMTAVTSKQARGMFPGAFSPAAVVWRSWSDGDRHFTRPWWRDYEDGTQEYTGKVGQ